jgi:hypothetical protein
MVDRVRYAVPAGHLFGGEKTGTILVGMRERANRRGICQDESCRRPLRDVGGHQGRGHSGDTGALTRHRRHDDPVSQVELPEPKRTQQIESACHFTVAQFPLALVHRPVGWMNLTTASFAKLRRRSMTYRLESLIIRLAIIGPRGRVDRRRPLCRGHQDPVARPLLEGLVSMMLASVI